MQLPAETSTPRQAKLALLAVGIAVLTWGWSNVASKTVSTSGLVISFYRLWFAVPALWIVPLVSPAMRSRLDRRWLRASIVGGLLFGIHQVFFFSSLKATSVANVSIIGSLQPILVILLAGRMFGERVTRRQLSWSALALFGTALVVIGSHGTPGWSPYGDVLATLNLFAFTFYFLASKRIRTEIQTTDYVIGMTTVSAIFMLFVCLASGQELGSPRSSDWPILVALALVSGTLGHLLTNWAHAHTSAFVISIMLLGAPVLASVGAAVFLGETLGPLQIVGGLLVLGAISTIVLSAHDEVAAEELAESVAETDAP